MSNEAAERLRKILASQAVTHVQQALLETALVGERLATVERIRAALDGTLFGTPSWSNERRILDAILAAEAQPAGEGEG